MKRPSKNVTFVLAVLMLVLYMVSATIFNIIFSAYLAEDGAALLASFSVVSSVLSFVSFFLGFLWTAAIALVGKADAARDHPKAGRYIVIMLFVGLVVGVIASIIVVAFANPIVRVLDPKGELDADTFQVLRVAAAGFWLGTITSSLTGIYMGLMNLITLSILSLFLGGSYAGFALGLYKSLGLFGYAWAEILSKSIYTILGLGVLFLPRFKKYKLFRTGFVNREERNEVLAAVGAALTGTSARSVFTNSRYFISLACAIRLGAVPGAVYTLVDKLSSATYIVTRSVAGIFGLVVARLYGSTEHGDVESLTALIRTSSFFTHLTLYWGVGTTIYFGVGGRDVLLDLAADDERDQYSEIYTDTAHVSMVAIQIMHAITSVYEIMLVSVSQFRFIGIMTTSLFFISYLPIVLYGYVNEQSVTWILMADFVYFALRSISCVIYFHFYLLRSWYADLAIAQAKREGQVEPEPRWPFLDAITRKVFGLQLTGVGMILGILISSWDAPAQDAIVEIEDEIDEVLSAHEEAEKIEEGDSPASQHSGKEGAAGEDADESDSEDGGSDSEDGGSDVEAEDPKDTDSKDADPKDGIAGDRTSVAESVHSKRSSKGSALAVSVTVSEDDL